MHRWSEPRRRAAMYVVALGASMVVTVIGIGAIVASRLENRYSGGAADFAQARFHARSAIEYASWAMNGDRTWRSAKPHGLWLTDQALGRGKFGIHVVDPVDSDLADSAGDDVVVTGVGEVGKARYQLSVQMAPYGPRGMDFLRSTIHAGTHVETPKTVTVDAPVSSNGTMFIRVTGVINGSVEAVSTINKDGVVTGTVTTPIASKEMPGASVFDYYTNQAVEIPYSAIASGVIDRALLGPTSNPYGATHPKGMYLIRCNGNTITVSNSRISGTLILLDPSASSAIDGNINWAPVDASLPALMVRGPMNFSWSGSLTESGGGPNVNFNPSGTPYNGDSDTDTDDTYPGLMKGLVYLSGSLSVNGVETIEGVVACGGTMTVNQNLNVTHDPSLVNAPPPGFERSWRPMAATAGTWKQLVD